MSPHDAKAMAAALKGLGGLGGAINNPVTRLAIRYWWVSIPVGLSFWSHYQERKESGTETRFYHIMNDFRDSVLPVTMLIALSEFARKKEREIGVTSARDAEFSVVDDEPEGYPQGSAA